MMEGRYVELGTTLFVVAVALVLTLSLLRVSRPALRNVFSRDLGVLRRRLLVGLADIGYSVFAVFLFFSGEMAVPVAQFVVALACLAVFVAGVTLWLLAGLQLAGLVFVKEKKPAEPPAQSNP